MIQQKTLDDQTFPGSKNGNSTIYCGNVIVIPRGCGSSFDSGQARHQSCRDVDDMEPGDIYFYVEKHRLLKKSNK